MSNFINNNRLEQWTPENGDEVIDAIRINFGDQLTILGYDIQSLYAGPKAIDVKWGNERYPLYTLPLSGPRPAMDTILACIEEHVNQLKNILHAFERPLREALGMDVMNSILDRIGGGTGDPEGMHITANPRLIPMRAEQFRNVRVPFTNNDGVIEYDASGILELQTALSANGDGASAWLYINTDSIDENFVEIEIYRTISA